MAKQEVGLKIDVDVQSVGSMKQQLKAATNDLIAMNEKFGSTSQQAIAAAQRVANLKDAIGDAKSLTDAFNPDAKFKAFGQTLGAVAGGFSAVQGAMGLLGSQSEDVEKTLLKVQSALALSQGIEQLGDLGQAFKNMEAVAVNSFKAIRNAIGSTGIGLLVVALGTIVAYWDEIKEAVSGVNEEQKRLNEESRKNLKTQQDKLNAITEQDNILKLQGKSEKEIVKEKIKQYDLVIKSAEAQIISDREIQKQREAAAQRNFDITKRILEGSTAIATFGLRALAAPIDILIETANLVSETLGFGKITSTNLNKEITKLNESVSTFAASFLFDPKQVKAEGDKASEEALKNLNKLKNDKAGFELQIKEIDKKAAADAAKTAEDAAKTKEQKDKEAAEKKAAADKVLEDARLAKLSEQKQAEEKIEADFRERKKTLEAAGINDFKAIEEQRGIELAAIRKKYADLEEAKRKEDEKKQQEQLAKKTDFLLKEAEDEQLSFQERLDKIKEREALKNQIIFESDEERKTFEKANADARLKIAEAESNARIMLARAVGDTLSALSDIVGRETAAGKALAIAQATINTFLGITEVWKAKSILPEPFNTASKIAATITTAAGGFAAVRRIAQTSVPGAGGGGGGGGVGNLSAPVTPALAPQVVATQVNTAAVNQMGNRAARAYVLNSDIQNDNQRNAYIDRSASIG